MESDATLVEACAEAAPLLALPEPFASDYLEAVDVARESLRSGSDALIGPLRRIRHILVEATDNPVGAVLVDRIARRLDDGVGGLFGDSR